MAPSIRLGLVLGVLAHAGTCAHEGGGSPHFSGSAPRVLGAGFRMAEAPRVAAPRLLEVRPAVRANAFVPGPEAAAAAVDATLETLLAPPVDGDAVSGGG